MEQSAEEEECGICLDALTNPVALPCSHNFCSECLNGWRSKYGVKSGEDEMDRKCPMCREQIPPTKEMVAQLKCWRTLKSKYERDGDVFSQYYMNAKHQVEFFEREIGDWTQTIDYADDDDNKLMLPENICEAACKNDIQKVLSWLGPPPVDKRRVNARCPDQLDFTLVFAAVLSCNSVLLSILLHLAQTWTQCLRTG